MASKEKLRFFANTVVGQEVANVKGEELSRLPTISIMPGRLDSS